MSGKYVIVQMDNGEDVPLNLKEVTAFGRLTMGSNISKQPAGTDWVCQRNFFMNFNFSEGQESVSQTPSTTSHTPGKTKNTNLPELLAEGVRSSI